MSPQEHLQFLIGHHEEKYPEASSPIIYLIDKTAEELIDAFKCAKGRMLTEEHFKISKRKMKKLAKLEALEAQQHQMAA
jgi:hypothetical protein